MTEIVEKQFGYDREKQPESFHLGTAAWKKNRKSCDMEQGFDKESSSTFSAPNMKSLEMKSNKASTMTESYDNGERLLSGI